MEPFYQGPLDVFLVGLRAEFNAVEDQGKRSLQALIDYSMVGTDSKANALYLNVGASTPEGMIAVWRHTGTTGVNGPVGHRAAGDRYPDTSYIRNWETAVYDPDNQDANQIVVPEERLAKEATLYKTYLNRGQKLYEKFVRQNVLDTFELLNLAWTLPTSYPSAKFFAKGSQGLNGSYTALNERLISTQHALANGGTTQSNAIQTAGNASPFSTTTYFAAKEQGGATVDDIAEPMPMFGGMLDIYVPNHNGMVKAVKVINESMWEPAGANNDINVLKSGFERIVTSPYIGTSYYLPTISNLSSWLLADRSSVDPEIGTGFVRVEFWPMDSKVERVNPNDAIAYKVKQEYSYGYVDWRNFLGSKGDGLPYSG